MCTCVHVCTCVCMGVSNWCGMRLGKSKRMTGALCLLPVSVTENSHTNKSFFKRMSLIMKRDQIFLNRPSRAPLGRPRFRDIGTLVPGPRRHHPSLPKACARPPPGSHGARGLHLPLGMGGARSLFCANNRLAGSLLLKRLPPQPPFLQD